MAIKGPEEHSHFNAQDTMTGIGRPVMGAWLTDALTIVETLIPNDARVNLRPTPAVNFVSGEDLARVTTASLMGIDEEGAAAERVKDYLDSLVQKEQINPVVLEPVNVGIKSVFLEGRFGPRSKSVKYKLGISLYDRGYLDGVVATSLYDEKTAIKKALGLPVRDRPLESDRDPMHLLKIGKIVTRRGLNRKNFERTLKRELPSRMVGLGATREISINPAD